MRSKNAKSRKSPSVGGRPTKYTPETVKMLLEGAKAGSTNKAACRAAGISEDTLANWKNEHPELLEKIEAAREAGRVKALREIQAAGAKDWRAHEAWLKLTSPEHRPGRDAAISAVQINSGLTPGAFTKADLEALRELKRLSMSDESAGSV
jgi:hypothetical protein